MACAQDCIIRRMKRLVFMLAGLIFASACSSSRGRNTGPTDDLLIIGYDRVKSYDYSPDKANVLLQGAGVNHQLSFILMTMVAVLSVNFYPGRPAVASARRLLAEASMACYCLTADFTG